MIFIIVGRSQMRRSWEGFACWHGVNDSNKLLRHGLGCHCARTRSLLDDGCYPWNACCHNFCFTIRQWPLLEIFHFLFFLFPNLKLFLVFLYSDIFYMYRWIIKSVNLDIFVQKRETNHQCKEELQPCLLVGLQPGGWLPAIAAGRATTSTPM